MWDMMKSMLDPLELDSKLGHESSEVVHMMLLRAFPLHALYSPQKQEELGLCCSLLTGGELTDFIPEMPLAFSSLIYALNCQHVKSQIAIALLYVLQRLFICLAPKREDLWEKC